MYLQLIAHYSMASLCQSRSLFAVALSPWLFLMPSAHLHAVQALPPKVQAQAFSIIVVPCRTNLLYSLQLGHIYPKPGAPLSEQVIIDLSQNPEELAAAKGDEYPLIFRLETISEKGLADGHILEVCVQLQSKRAHMPNGSIICLH